MIDAPWFNSPVEQAAFNAFAYHKQNIEDFIDALAKADDPNDPECQYAAARSSGLNVGSLTAAEINYIKSEVSKRC